MKCKLCESENIEVAYHGYIRDGKVCSKTPEEIDIYRCKKCGVMWHHAGHDLKTFYESKDYRMELESTSDIEDFYQLHDFESLDKFCYTGTDCFRHKIVADIGCGGGAFLDFLSGVSDKIIAVEPSDYYRNILKQKGYFTYPYASDAYGEFSGQVDVITSFDVIEHVDDPIAFLKDVFILLKEGGRAAIGTPTEAPLMRKLIGKDYDQKLLFSTQHIWVFNSSSLQYAAKCAGFQTMQIRYAQRYGIGNMVAWLDEKMPRGNIRYDIIPDSLDAAFRSTLENSGLSDYVLIDLTK